MKKVLFVVALLIFSASDMCAQSLQNLDGECTIDLLKGNFDRKKFYIQYVDIYESTLGQSVIALLEKRGAKVLPPFHQDTPDFYLHIYPILDKPFRVRHGPDHGLRLRHVTLEVTLWCGVEDLTEKTQTTAWIRPTVMIVVKKFVAAKKNFDAATQELLPILDKTIPASRIKEQ